MAIKSVPLQAQNISVVEYWDTQVGWKWNAFEEYLPGEVIQQIASYELFSGNELSDRLYWRGDKSGNFRVKSAVKLVRNEQCSSSEDSWKWVWKVKAPQWCIVFLWLALHDRLLTNVNRVKRGLTVNPFCPLCNLDHKRC